MTQVPTAFVFVSVATIQLQPRQRATTRGTAAAAAAPAAAAAAAACRKHRHCPRFSTAAAAVCDDTAVSIQQHFYNSIPATMPGFPQKRFGLVMGFHQIHLLACSSLNQKAAHDQDKLLKKIQRAAVDHNRKMLNSCIQLEQHDQMELK